MKRYSVYCHTNKINGKKYIGMTSQIPERRWQNGKGYIGNEYFFGDIEIYGWHNFYHEILYCDLSKEEAGKYETKLIEEWETYKRDKGYNLDLGAGSSDRVLDETKRKLSEVLKGHPCSDETKKKIGDSKRGKPSPKKGLKMTKEQIEKNRLSHLGQKAWNKGRPWTDEEKAKCNGKAVICVETGKLYRTAHEASRETGVDFSSICKCRRGKVKTAGGFHWVSVKDWSSLSNG